MGLGLFVYGQDYPNKPMRIVVSKAGGGNDFMARTIGQGITRSLGQQVVIDNRPSNMEGEAAARAAPDGYTLLLGGASLWTLPLLQDVSYDPVKDFAPITLIERSPNILVVHPSLPAKSVKELIALAKARPGELNFASSGADTRLQGELFKALAGINIVNIPYSSGAVEYADLVAGQVHLKFGSTVSVAPHVKSGRLRALAVTTAQQSALYPSLPTVAAALPGYEAAAKAAMFVPAKTPDAIINRLNQEIGRFLRTGEAKEKFANAGSEAVTSSPEEAAATVKTDMARLGKLIKDTGMRAN
jgi:tripartite-type tricarboxylate transporter receptor subunit TctC